MGKSNTLAAMMAGAAMAAGLMYLKKHSREQQPASASDPLDAELDSLKNSAAEEERSWHATYTIDGEELDTDEIRARFKEEASKAMDRFREDAKEASEDILTGLKKALADVREAVEGAKKAAAERKAAAQDAAASDPVDAAFTEFKEAAQDIKDDIAQTVEEVKDAANRQD